MGITDRPETFAVLSLISFGVGIVLLTTATGNDALTIVSSMIWFALGVLYATDWLSEIRHD